MYEFMCGGRVERFSLHAGGRVSFMSRDIPCDDCGANLVARHQLLVHDELWLCCGACDGRYRVESSERDGLEDAVAERGDSYRN